MNRLRTALLVAAAGLAGLPAAALAQDRPHDRGGGEGRPGGPPPQGIHEHAPPAAQAAPRPARPAPQSQAQFQRGPGGFDGQHRPENFRPGGEPRNFQRPPQPPANVEVQRGLAVRPDDRRPEGSQNWQARPDERRFDRQQNWQGRPDDRRFDRPQNWQGRTDDRRSDRQPNWQGRSDDNRFDRPQNWQGRAEERRFDRPALAGRPDWRNDRRYDWRAYREQHREVFRAPRYVPPRGYGYGYRRFGIGYRLAPFFFAQNYWIGDPGYYNLPPAYGPYRWVRYYNDALLVDLRTGEIVDETPDFFW